MTNFTLGYYTLWAMFMFAHQSLFSAFTFCLPLVVYAVWKAFCWWDDKNVTKRSMRTFFDD